MKRQIYQVTYTMCEAYDDGAFAVHQREAEEGRMINAHLRELSPEEVFRMALHAAERNRRSQYDRVSPLFFVELEEDDSAKVDWIETKIPDRRKHSRLDWEPSKYSQAGLCLTTKISLF